MPPSVPARSWGTRFDTLPSSPPLSPPVQEIASAVSFDSVSDSSSRKKDDKLPHDASVFVGSLPSNIDHGELTRMLLDHLSEHTQIKNIKVVRDSKGGVCAFVQCQSAEAGSALIHTLHSNEPKPFLGRFLRYEPARAFRTLLISYRAPIQAIGPPTKDAQIVELTLPSAMRMWKPSASRFFNILYNGDAVNAETRAAAQTDLPFRDNGIFLQPVEHNADTIRKLATFFGRLENFGLYQVLGAPHDNNARENFKGEETWKSYPVPHNAPRSHVMDKSCWEIKWEHRDDCVSALMTLRRVPHLTVTWAHQPPAFGFDHRLGNIGPNINSTPYPLHPQDSSLIEHPSSLQTSPSHTSTGIALHQRNTREPAVQSQEPDPKLPTQDTSDGLRGATSPERFGWTNTDFPPLSGPGTTKWKAWSETIEEELCDSPNLFPGTGDVLDSVPCQDAIEQELIIPETPGLETSPTTPRTPGPLYPLTPNSCGGDLRNELCEVKDHPYFNTMRPDRELDPTTLFVGGLEMFGPGAWNEEKVREFFSRFGGLENVKLVKPTNSCAAFAFVKFDNTESPARAVYEEHNRVYEGRAMRVQLRDCNPPRSPWKHTRGRGRFQNHDQFSPRRFILPDGFGDRAPFNIGQDQVISAPHDDTLGGSFTPEHSNNIGIFGKERGSDLLVVPRTQKSDERLSADATPEPVAQQDRSPGSLLTSQQTENYREWYDDLESPANTPTLPSFNPSASVNTSFTSSPYSYPLPNSPYYSAMHWMQPYAQQPQYPMPFYNGYPMYPPHLPPPLPAFTTPPGSDANGPAGGPGWPPVGMYGSYIPYPMHPSRAQGADQAPQQMGGQAPLMPTGFIQNDQGTLIAVYQPEALDQYMAGVGTAYPGGLPRLQNPNGPPWPQYTHPYPPCQSVPSRPSQYAATNTGWSHPGLPIQAAGHIAQNPNSQRTNPGTVERNTNPPHSITAHRRQGRRDPHFMVNASRNNPRTFSGRHSRINAQPPALSFQGMSSQQTHLIRSSGGPAEWNQWGSKT